MINRFDDDLKEVDIFESPVYISEDKKIRIDSCVNLSNSEPYFKLFKGDNCLLNNIYNETVNMCRISMINPIYINGVGSNFKLDKDDISKLIRILTSKNQYNNKISNWEYMIISYNNDVDGVDCIDKLPNDINIPNYIELK